MALSYILHDIKAVLKGMEAVASAGARHQAEVCGKIWENSSIKTAAEEGCGNINEKLKTMSQSDINAAVKETAQRTYAVLYGFKSLATYPYTSQNVEEVKHEKKEQQHELPKGVSPDDLKAVELDYKDQLLIKQLEMEHDLKVKLNEKDKEPENIPLPNTTISSEDKYTPMKHVKYQPLETSKPQQPTAKKYQRQKQELNPSAKQRKVPASRVGRMISFGGLAAGLGVGTLAEVARRAVGLRQTTGSDDSSALDHILLTEANADRIVNTLCRVRGAALKIGQILSIQDNSIISPTFQKAFERVRQSADFMPTWQVHKVLSNEIGEDWRSKFREFDEKPFAAASIGQVHYVVLHDGREAAMKIQYPGVAEGIESDINNLIGIMKIWNVFPKGLFIDNLVEVAKRELAWEVDYLREAECTRKFKTLFSPYPDYVVPDVIDELSSKRVFTTTLVDGEPIDKCADLPDEDKNRIARLLMQLCLRELFEFQYMQTDPNWSNFFYDRNSGKMALLDFGASRSYDDEFIAKYLEVIKAATDGDRGKVLSLSQQMGFLTGYESKAMEDAHVDAVVILAEVFSSDKEFDFGRQDTTLRIQKLVPTIVSERLCPPPEEIYSLHRKLSGIFLLCAKLKVKISCRKMFLDVYNQKKRMEI
ncbi:UNVERIFIED_CONTAM: hypothetical protein PYX00_009517 [Menopon gallinae]|uniref:ABC1 atypical kinase-like domain-containing protein n=1 Tax=Menopon gallinae TaxID=328185 RepID=A0AAW2HBJ9_9NEOP